MEVGIYKSDVLQKLAGISLILGAILLVVFGALHPSEDLEDKAELIQTIADNNGGYWEIDHILIAVSFWVLMIGIVGVYRSISSGGGSAWVRLGFYGMIVATALRTVFLAFDGVGLAAVVNQWEGATGADKTTLFILFSSLEDALDGLRSMTDIFYGLALVFVGVGVALSTVYSRWLSGSIIIAGAIWIVVGFIIGISGSSSDLIIAFLIAFLLTVFWHIAMGIVITRREMQTK